MVTLDTQWINWWEIAPETDTFLCKVFKQETTMNTESGLIINTEESKVEDRPTSGQVVAVGPDAPFKVDDVLFWRKESGYDMEMIRKETEDDRYMLLHPQAVLGKRVKDTRES